MWDVSVRVSNTTKQLLAERREEDETHWNEEKKNSAEKYILVTK